jgi:hypothetical protein
MGNETKQIATENINRLSSLKNEKRLKETAGILSSLFAQIDDEMEFIEAIEYLVPDTNFASLLWHALNDQQAALRMLYRHGHSLHTNEE